MKETKVNPEAVKVLNDQIANINSDYVKFIKKSHSSTGTYTESLGTNRQFILTVDRYSVQSSTYGGLYYIDTDNTGAHVYPISPSSAISSISVNESGIATYTTGITYMKLCFVMIGR